MNLKLLIALPFLIFSTLCFSQEEVRNIEENKLSSYTWTKEIRIEKVKKFERSEIIQIYQDSTLQTVVSHYKHGKYGELQLDKETIIKDKDFWLKVEKYHLKNLADEENISYKFKSYENIESGNNKATLVYNKPEFLGDTEDYYFTINDGKMTNHFKYSNPDFLIKIFPEIDELQSIVSTLDLVRKETGFWSED